MNCSIECQTVLKNVKGIRELTRYDQLVLLVDIVISASGILAVFVLQNLNTALKKANILKHVAAFVCHSSEYKPSEHRPKILRQEKYIPSFIFIIMWSEISCQTKSFSNMFRNVCSFQSQSYFGSLYENNL